MGDARGPAPTGGPTPGQRFGRCTVVGRHGAGGKDAVYEACRR